ncbi:MAG: hypothetical protein ACK4SL_02315 [Candidatus Paceibacteria bacterium]
MQGSGFFVLVFLVFCLLVVAGVLYNWRQWRREVQNNKRPVDDSHTPTLEQAAAALKRPEEIRRRDDDDGLAGSYAASQLAGFPVGGNAAGALLGAAAHQANEREEVCLPDNAGTEAASDSSDVCVSATDDQSVGTPDQGGYESTDSGGFDPNN